MQKCIYSLNGWISIENPKSNCSLKALNEAHHFDNCGLNKIPSSEATTETTIFKYSFLILLIRKRKCDGKGPA